MFQRLSDTNKPHDETKFCAAFHAMKSLQQVWERKGLAGGPSYDECYNNVRYQGYTPRRFWRALTVTGGGGPGGMSAAPMPATRVVGVPTRPAQPRQRWRERPPAPSYLNEATASLLSPMNVARNDALPTPGMYRQTDSEQAPAQMEAVRPPSSAGTGESALLFPKVGSNSVSFWAPQWFGGRGCAEGSTTIFL